MPHFKIAHIREQGNDMIIIPLDDAFEFKSPVDQSAIIDEFQLHASAAGLAGEVVPVWNRGGRMRFIAPQPWHPYFKSLSLDLVALNVNKELSW